MKKKALAILLPVAAGVALAGTGFGTWIFKTTNKATIKAGLEVTPAIQITEDSLTATITVKNNGTGDYDNQNLVFDQGYTTWGVKIDWTLDVTYNAGGADTLDNNTKGNTATWADGTGSLTEFPKELANYQIKSTWTAALTDYVTVDAAEKTQSLNATGLNFEKSKTDGHYTLSGGSFEYTYTATKKYTDEITDMTAYEALLAAVASSDFVYNLELVEAA